MTSLSTTTDSLAGLSLKGAVLSLLLDGSNWVSFRSRFLTYLEMLDCLDLLEPDLVPPPFTEPRPTLADDADASAAAIFEAEFKLW
jgi:hypothetical protein